jgi:hypothetical protein
VIGLVTCVRASQPRAPVSADLAEVGRLPLELVERAVGAVRRADRHATLAVVLILILEAFNIAIK